MIQYSETVVTHKTVTAYWMPRLRGHDDIDPKIRIWSLLFLLVHRQHPLRHQKAAENIHRCEDQRDEAEAPRPNPAAADHGDADREQCADHDHRGDRVG